MRTFFKILLALTFVLTLFSRPALAQNYSVFVGTASNYSGLGSARFGFGPWELGMYTQDGALGFSKRYKANQNWYTSFGFAYYYNALGFLLTGGFEWAMFWGLNLRSELIGVQNVTGEAFGIGTIGLSLNF